VDIALKIERFIKCQQREKEHSFSRVTEDEYSYAEAVQQSKWGSSNLRRAEINTRKEAF